MIDPTLSLLGDAIAAPDAAIAAFAQAGGAGAATDAPVDFEALLAQTLDPAGDPEEGEPAAAPVDVALLAPFVVPAVPVVADLGAHQPLEPAHRESDETTLESEASSLEPTAAGDSIPHDVQAAPPPAPQLQAPADRALETNPAIVAPVQGPAATFENEAGAIGDLPAHVDAHAAGRAAANVVAGPSARAAAPEATLERQAGPAPEIRPSDPTNAVALAPAAPAGETPEPERAAAEPRRLSPRAQAVLRALGDLAIEQASVPVREPDVVLDLQQPEADGSVPAAQTSPAKAGEVASGPAPVDVAIEAPEAEVVNQQRQSVVREAAPDAHAAVRPAAPSFDDGRQQPEEQAPNQPSPATRPEAKAAPDVTVGAGRDIASGGVQRVTRDAARDLAPEPARDAASGQARATATDAAPGSRAPAGEPGPGARTTSGPTAPQPFSAHVAASLQPPVHAPAVQAAVPQTVGESNPELTAQIVQTVRLQWRQGVGEATLRLQPAHLGAVTVALRVERGAVEAVLQAENPAVQQWIESHAGQLRSALADQGLQLDRFVVRTDPDGRQPDRDRRGQARPRQPRGQERQAQFEVRA